MRRKERQRLWCIFDIDNKSVLKKKLEAKTQDSVFWNNKNEAKEVQAQLKAINNDITKTSNISKAFEDVEVMLQLLENEKDESLEKEVIQKYSRLLALLDAEEFNLMFSGKYDSSNAIVSIHAGAGGTESCDWVEMLLRMYLMWSEKKGFKTAITDIQPGDEAGIKNVTFEAIGDHAYGNFRAEKGVHRLVRISPFDSNKRRHTSFASVEAIPEIEDDIEVEIKEDDLKVDTYRASGAGGQHVNKTESAIRITHVPTGVIVACQIDRSQAKNRERAMKMLRSKLVAMKEEQQKENIEQIAGEKKDIAWGHQIRSYVLHPYKMIKDLRTDVERGDVDRVLDGDLDIYIQAFLKMEAENNAKN
jgi:peptide chain release factor 2